MKDKKFVAALLIVVVLSAIAPEPALPGSMAPLMEISSIGIFLIFFFYGLKLDRKNIARRLGNFRLHLLIQFTTFLLFPLIVLALLPAAHTELQRTLWLGSFFLAVLPSTVSTSVVMIDMAKGNLTAGIFNASLSGLIGIVVTPIWMGLFLAGETGEFNYTQVFLKLMFEIILPVFLGMVLQPVFYHLAVKFSRQITLFDKGVILLIIYRSFAVSFSGNHFSDISLINLALLSAGIVLLFFAVYGLVWFAATKLGFQNEDRITALVCATQKSLIHGSVFSNVLFGQLYYAGLLLLPIMLYHTLQILFFSVVITKWSENNAK